MDLVLRKLATNDEGAFLRALALTTVSDPRFAHYYRPDVAFSYSGPEAPVAKRRYWIAL